MNTTTAETREQAAEKGTTMQTTTTALYFIVKHSNHDETTHSAHATKEAAIQAAQHEANTSGDKMYVTYHSNQGTTCIPIMPNIDTHAARELRLYIDNDYPTYQHGSSVATLLTKYMRKGTYNHARAPKAWMYVVDRAAKKYCTENGGSVRYTFPKAVREHVAQELADGFYNQEDVYC